MCPSNLVKYSTVSKLILINTKINNDKVLGLHLTKGKACETYILFLLLAIFGRYPAIFMILQCLSELLNKLVGTTF